MFNRFFKFFTKEKLQQWREKYLLIVYDGNTLKENFQLHISKLDLSTYLTIVLLLTGLFWFFMFKYSILRDLIGYESDPAMRRNIIANAQRLDSLEEQILVRDEYYDNLKRILKGDLPNSKKDETQSQEDTDENAPLEVTESGRDSILRQQLAAEQNDFWAGINDAQNGAAPVRSIVNLKFYTPIKGVITGKFDPANEHNGIDVVAAANRPIQSTLPGTVVYADWSMETGFVIAVQHDNDMVSLYKHNASLLKKVGDHVRGGEAIAIIGNSGELTTGPHLHFELWQNGMAVDPENFIVF